MNIKERIRKVGSHVAERINGKTISPAMKEEKEKYEENCREIFSRLSGSPSNFKPQDFRKFTRSMFYLLGGNKNGKDSYSNPLIFTNRFKVEKIITFNKSKEDGPHINIKIDHSAIILMPNLKHILFEVNAADMKSEASMSQYEPVFIERVINRNIMIRPNAYPSHINPITAEFAFGLCRKYFEKYQSKENKPADDIRRPMLNLPLDNMYI